MCLCPPQVRVPPLPLGAYTPLSLRLLTQRWKLALELLAEMEAAEGDAADAPPDVISYSSVAAAHQLGRSGRLGGVVPGHRGRARLHRKA